MIGRIVTFAVERAQHGDDRAGEWIVVDDVGDVALEAQRDCLFGEGTALAE